MLQPNFHWSFTDNQRYTWNLYNGFSPLVEENGRTNLIEGRFFDTPDIMSEDYSVYSNNTGFAENNSLPLHIDNDIGCPQINRDIIRLSHDKPFHHLRNILKNHIIFRIKIQPCVVQRLSVP